MCEAFFSLKGSHFCMDQHPTLWC